MDNKINNNGYDYVDLELPSRTLWSTCNVGAKKPSDFGQYFQWGDTKGYTKEQVGKDKQFTWNDYKFNPSGDWKTFTKYIKEGAKLELEDDAANFNMGGNWHIPTPKQIKELLSNTTNTWTKQNGINGRLFTSKTDTSKSIFIPAAGYVYDGSLKVSGYEADVWASMLNTGYVDYGQNLYFYSKFIKLSSGYRYCGFPIRGVIG